MANQKRVSRWLLAGIVAVALSGCVSVPDAIKGSSPTPQEDLVRVMNAPQLYVGQESRFGGKVVKVINQKGKTRLEIAAVPLDPALPPPRHWQRVDLPAMRYLVAWHAGHVSSIRSTWRWLREHYLPAARIALADTPAFERYDRRFDDRSGDGGVELWLPLAEIPQPD